MLHGAHINKKIIPFWATVQHKHCIMKLLINVVAAFAVFGSLSCQESGKDEVLANLEYYMRGSVQSPFYAIKSKVERLCPGKSEDFQNVTLELIECKSTLDDNKETMCSLTQKFSSQCSGPFIKFFEGCLPETAKYLPAMVVDFTKKLEVYLCKIDGEHIFELFNRCVINITQKTERCLRTVTARAQDYEVKGKYPTLRELCEQIESMRPCLQSHLNGACGHPTTREMWLGAYDVVKSSVCTESLNEVEPQYEINQVRKE